MGQLICNLLLIYWLILVVRIVMSWFPIQPGGVAERIYSLVFAVTEPVLAPVRGLLPPVRLGGAGLDLSPLLVFVVIIILQRIFCG